MKANPPTVRLRGCVTTSSKLLMLEHIFAQNGLLLTLRQGFRLFHHITEVIFEAIAVAIRAQIDLGDDDRVTTAADFVLHRVA